MWKKCAVLLIICFCSFAQAATEGRGLIDELNFESGYIGIDGQKYKVKAEQLKIIYEGNFVRISEMTEGLFVRYSQAENGYIEQIWLVGPQNKIQQLLSH